MAVEFYERTTSGNLAGNEPTRDLEFVCTGLDDETAVFTLAMQVTSSVLPHPLGTLYRQDIKVNRQGTYLFYVSVPYTRTNQQSGEWTWDFDTSGGTFNIKASRETVASYTAGGAAVTNFKGAIGVQLDGTVDGVDIVIPTFKLNATYKHPLGVVTLNYAYQLADLTGTVNSTTIFGRAPGEVLFLGSRGSDGTNAEGSVSYSFAISPNLQNKLIGGITVAEKAGHDYAWIRFKNNMDGTRPATEPLQINVERVYEQRDLRGALGFG